MAVVASWSVSRSPHGDSVVLLLEATNVGRQPATIKEASFALAWEERRLLRGPVVRRSIQLRGEGEEMRVDDRRWEQLKAAAARRQRFGQRSLEIMRTGEAEPSHLPVTLRPGDGFRFATEAYANEVREWHDTTEQVRPFVVDTQGRNTLGPPLQFTDLADLDGE
jgi:hypothetical protein